MADENLREQHTSTPWMCDELDSITLQEQDKDGLETIFWVLRGTGSKRDKFMRFSQFKKWLDAAKDVIAEIQDNGISEIKEKFTFVNESGVNAVLRESGIWFEYPDGVHAFVSKDGFGYHYVDGKGDTVEVELNKDGLFLGDGIQIINGLSVLRGLAISGILRIEQGGSLVMSGIFSAQESGFVVRTDFKVGEAVEIQQNGNVRADGSVDANVLSAKKTVNGPAFCASIFDATTLDLVRDPASLLHGVEYVGATALVRNMSGSNYVLHRLVSGNQYADFVVAPGEILQYVYDGSTWVHSW